ncbi:hypothetical protein FYM84_12815 [Pseudomonas sp. CAH-1]|uniref:Uncharacterized protein n=1 Tax=Pseudomonas juntendi TaxID=2666183 RepID=A0A7W2LS63_9PSED|nr:hypothetical protein [Pseudomonas juntendi]MBA6146077.1 hypothetical protein [Pseudomonas juntendi]MRT61495.1 hypothetical protein [Pseudomonas sp. CAH-1]QOH73405.1 hypothetical protein IGB31_07095 [Pseudomonas putida]
MFTVNPGICAHDALVHVAQYLRGAYGCGYKALEHLGETGKSLFWGNLNAVSELRLPVPASSRACPFPQVLQWV